MILQALKEYYDRKAAEGNIASEGWIHGGIDFIIHIDKAGNYRDISYIGESVGRKKLPKPMNVPNIGKQALKHSNSGKDANLLWDNASFVLGLGDKGDLRLDSMIQAIDHWIGMGVDSDSDAVRAFFEKGRQDRKHFLPILSNPEYGEELSKGGAKISFKVAGSDHKIIFDSPIVAKVLSKESSMPDSENAITGTCLITGQENVPIELTHTVIKGVWGTQTSGACIVSFNKDKPSFNSYCKEQSLNAPVGKLAASEYVKSLNVLLGSKQCIHIGDASTVFWSEKNTSFESDFSFFFSEPPKDDPDAGTRKVKALFESVNSGAYCNDDSDSRFYVLGLAPNAARIAVRFWQVGTIGQFAEKIRQHFEDIDIDHAEFDTEYCTLNELLSSVATETKDINKKNRVYFRGKYYDVPPNLAGSVLESILNGSPYPITLLHQCMRRIRAEVSLRNQNGKLLMNVTRARAAILRASINRFNRFYNPNKKEVTMGLDIESKDVGYLLGRLFAVLERVQIQSAGGEGKLNATIRDRFYGAFSSSPMTVMPMILKLKNHHLAKIGSSKGFFEGLIGQVMDGLDALKIPSHLTLEQQAHLAVGYYHQRQDFFKKQ